MIEGELCFADGDFAMAKEALATAQRVARAHSLERDRTLTALRISDLVEKLA